MKLSRVVAVLMLAAVGSPCVLRSAQDGFPPPIVVYEFRVETQGGTVWQHIKKLTISPPFNPPQQLVFSDVNQRYSAPLCAYQDTNPNCVNEDGVRMVMLIGSASEAVE